MKKIVVILLVCVVAAGGVLLFKKRKQVMVATPVAIPVTSTVKAVRPEIRTVSQVNAYLGRLESEHIVVVASKVNSRVVQLFVHEDQHVKKGAALVSLDDQEIKASIAAVQAKRGAALKRSGYTKTIYERNKGLYEVGGLALEKLEAAELDCSTAQAVVAELEQNIIMVQNQLEYCHLKAPFDGVVGTVFLHSGDLASLGKPILSLNSIPQKLTFRFVQGRATLKPGQVVLLADHRVGVISTLYDDAKMGLWVAEVVLDHRLDYPSGSYLTVEVVTKTDSGCAVPVSALLHRSQGLSVMGYHDSHFSEQPVTVMVQGKGFVLIEPCVQVPVAIASEAKLSVLPTYGQIKISMGGKDE